MRQEGGGLLRESTSGRDYTRAHGHMPARLQRPYLIEAVAVPLCQLCQLLDLVAALDERRQLPRGRWKGGRGAKRGLVRVTAVARGPSTAGCRRDLSVGAP